MKKLILKDAKLIPAAGYIRMSTDAQKDSPARQRREIEQLASHEGCVIVEWYEDHGKTGTKSDNRPNFQRMLVDAKSHKFEVVLVHEHSRFSREEMFAAFRHFEVLRNAGVRLITSRRGEVNFDDLAGMITTMVDQHAARAESIKISDRVTSGKRMRAVNGKRTGSAPFGYDRHVFDSAGKPVKVIGYYDRERVPGDWTAKLVPSHELAPIVKQMYKDVLGGKSLVGVARQLNNDGVKTKMGKLFQGTDVKRLLTNPVYVGTLRYGAKPQGQFVDPKAAPIVIPNNHPRIVSQKVYDEVQNIILAASFTRTPSDRTGSYLLTGLIRCACCGGRLTGATYRTATGEYGYYRCDAAAKGRRCEDSVSLPVDCLERQVCDLLAEKLLTGDFYRDVLQAAQTLPANEDEQSADGMQIDALERKLAQAEENMATAASKENFDAMARLCDRWRNELAELRSQRRVLSTKIALSDKEVRILASLKPSDIQSAPRHSLAVAIHSVVQSVRLKYGKGGFTGCMGTRHYAGEMVLHEAFGLPVLPFNLEIPLARHRKPEQSVATFFQRLGAREFTAYDLAEFLGVGQECAKYHLKRAIARDECVMSHVGGNGPNRNLYRAAK